MSITVSPFSFRCGRKFELKYYSSSQYTVRLNNTSLMLHGVKEYITLFDPPIRINTC